MAAVQGDVPAEVVVQRQVSTPEFNSSESTRINTCNLILDAVLQF
jgi:hypothetical protein